MDAATLYTVIAVGSGPRRMTTEKFPTMAICEEVADKLRKKASLKTATFYCVKRKAEASERMVSRRSRPPRPAAAAPPPAAAAPVGMPRDFFTGTTPKM
jgi:hypothetical protein